MSGDDTTVTCVSFFSVSDDAAALRSLLACCMATVMMWKHTNAEAVVPGCKNVKRTVQNNATLHHFLRQCNLVLYEAEAAAEACSCSTPGFAAASWPCPLKEHSFSKLLNSCWAASGWAWVISLRFMSQNSCRCTDFLQQRFLEHHGSMYVHLLHVHVKSVSLYVSCCYTTYCVCMKYLQ